MTANPLAEPGGLDIDLGQRQLLRQIDQGDLQRRVGRGTHQRPLTGVAANVVEVLGLQRLHMGQGGGKGVIGVEVVEVEPAGFGRLRQLAQCRVDGRPVAEHLEPGRFSLTD